MISIDNQNKNQMKMKEIPKENEIQPEDEIQPVEHERQSVQY